MIAFPTLAFRLLERDEPRPDPPGRVVTNRLSGGTRSALRPAGRLGSHQVLLLTLFALIAGAGTALSPCVLPVLPAVLAAGATGGGAGRWGWSSGLALSFTFATVALVYLIDALGLPDDFARTLAIVVLRRLRRGPAGPAAGRPGRGLRSAALVGGPPAGRRRRARVGAAARRQPRPRLRALRRADPRRRDHRLGVAGASPPPSSPSRSPTGSGPGPSSTRSCSAAAGSPTGWRRSRARVKVAMGAVMVAVAVMLAPTSTSASRRYLADDVPSASSSTRPRRRGELGDRRRPRLAARRRARARRGRRAAGRRRRATRCRCSAGPPSSPVPACGSTRRPALDRPACAGKVVLIDFWTYTCINCIRTLPHVRGLVRALPRRRAGGRRGPHARVPVRADLLERRGGDRRQRAHLPGRPGQRLRDLERLSATSTGRRST